jgi:peptidyl-prolyl cis-trans isomerase D
MKSGVNAKASHILIDMKVHKFQIKKKKERKKKAKAESILAQVNANPDSFMMLAFTNSDDSSAQGGDLGYFGPNQMVKPLMILYLVMVLVKLV